VRENDLLRSAVGWYWEEDAKHCWMVLGGRRQALLDGTGRKTPSTVGWYWEEDAKDLASSRSKTKSLMEGSEIEKEPPS